MIFKAVLNGRSLSGRSSTHPTFVEIQIYFNVFAGISKTWLKGVLTNVKKTNKDPTLPCCVIWCLNVSECLVHNNVLIVNRDSYLPLKCWISSWATASKTQLCVLLMTLHIVTGRNGLQRGAIFMISSQLQKHFMSACNLKNQPCA